ncbi:DUF3618 domain-containing protein [Allokutzneria oryzae]|uniref:DUF3618 domain-containing protein n=1 Tax=Allokutzneria oryzae TaxID=1378989 RepID=A0ABV6A768_9PSEU
MTKADRYTMPGAPPTDEDLRHEVELTRHELVETLAELTDRFTVKNAVRRHRTELIIGALVVGGLVVLVLSTR